MPRLNAANNARTTLAQNISSADTSFTVADASVFPSPPFRITINAEIMEVGAVDVGTNTFSSVQRGLEGTSPVGHNEGDYVENRWTAGTLAELADKAQLDEHKADYANPHQVKAEQVFALGGIPAGTAFPTSPPPYTLFFRTDLGKLFVYLP
jgi:hypothetical protein